MKSEKATLRVMRIDTIDRDNITDKFDIAEYRSGESMLAVTHRLDGIGDKHLKTALHTHSYYEFEIITGGRGVQLLDRSSFDMSRGCAYLRTPMNPHTTHEDPGDRLKSYNIRFTSDFIPSGIPAGLMAGGSAFHMKFDENELPPLITKAEELTAEIRRGDAYSVSMMRSLFAAILIPFVRRHATADEADGNVRDRHVKEIIRYIGSSYRAKLTVSDLAARFGLNPHYMGSLFIKETGKSIPAYINELRLILAAGLLASSSLNVNEICYECGFSSPSYFIMKFREKYGAAPGAWKEAKSE